jgi:hypothetical protein
MIDCSKLKLERGFYWVNFAWGWEPAQWTGDEFLRTGIESGWTVSIKQVGPKLEPPEKT